MHLSIALVGYGHVGRAFVEVLAEARPRLSARYGLDCDIVGLATRRRGMAINKLGFNLDELLGLTSGADLGVLHCCPAVSSTLEFIRATEADVVVEATVLDVESGATATRHIETALECGSHVITVNKGPIACGYRELRRLADRHRRLLRFEGTVMDGTPVFNLVRETLPGCEVLGFRGVLNSTTNVILSRMEDGQSLDGALAEARLAGIVEADESLDLDGLDAAAKTAALVNVLMEGDLRPRAIPTGGIRDVSPASVQAARRDGYRVRLVATADRSGGSIEARVAPALVPEGDLLATLRGTSNALMLRTDLMGELAIVESNPGVRQTAYAVLSDLLSIAREAGGIAVI